MIAGTHRQQYFLHTLMDDILHQELRKEPIAVYRILDTVSRGLSVESGWSSGNMRNLSVSLRNLRSAKIAYLVVPVLTLRASEHVRGSDSTPP